MALVVDALFAYISAIAEADSQIVELTPEKRPQDTHLNGTGLRFETMEHGGEYPDAMPQAIRMIDAEGRSCIYVPLTQGGKVVDSQRFAFDLEED